MKRDESPTSAMARKMWDGQYGREIYVYGKEPNDFLRAHVSALPRGGEVLCLADGEGRNSVFLAEQGFTVTAVDISPAGVEKGRKLAAERGVDVTFVCADLAGYELGDARWDGIVSISCHLPPPIRQPLFASIAAALRDGGVLLLEGYTPEQLRYGTGGPPLAEMMTSKETLLEELTGLDFSRLEELERDVVEGVNHSGLAAVVQAIASPAR